MGLTAHRTWKFNVPHSFGVHHAITPDPYRGLWGRDDVDAGKKYAADVKNLIDYGTSGQSRGFIAESIQGVGGCVVFPDGYLKHAYEHVRAAGGLCIADEVQTGFGRTGTHFWGFETQGVIPDIVTMAKESATAARSPPSSPRRRSRDARGADSLQHLRRKSGCLRHGQSRSRSNRERKPPGKLAEDRRGISAGFKKLKEKHNVIGDVRGKGLMLGVELVKDRATKEPAKAECAQVLETLPGNGPAYRQRRLGDKHSFLAADVHPSGGRRLHPRGVRSSAESALAEGLAEASPSERRSERPSLTSRPAQRGRLFALQ